MLKAGFREKCEGIHIRIGLLFSRFGIAPNTWTVLSLIPAALGFVFLYYKMLFGGLVLFVISGFIDIVDGNVARVTKSVSNRGAFLDGIVDRYVEFALYLGLWFYIEPLPQVLISNSLWILLLLFGALMPSFITAYADHKNVIQDPERLKNLGGFLERFERLSLLYLGMLLGLINPVWLVYVVILTVFFAHLTAVGRIYAVVRASKAF